MRSFPHIIFICKVVVFDLILFTFDIVSDFAVVYNHAKDGNYLIFGLTLFFAIIPTLLMNWLSIPYIKKFRSARTFNVELLDVSENNSAYHEDHATSFWMKLVRLFIGSIILRIYMIRLIYQIFFKREHWESSIDNTGLQRKMKQMREERLLKSMTEEEKCHHLQIKKVFMKIEVFFEAIPQILIQGYLLAEKYKMTQQEEISTTMLTQMISILISLLTAAIGICQLSEAVHVLDGYKHKSPVTDYNLFETLIQIIWRWSMLLARFICIIFFTIVYRYWIIIVFIIHGLVRISFKGIMTYKSKKYAENHNIPAIIDQSYMKIIVYSMHMSSVIVGYFSPFWAHEDNIIIQSIYNRDHHWKSHKLIDEVVYVVEFIENLIIIALLYRNDSFMYPYKEIILALPIVAFIVGVIFMALFYIFHYVIKDYIIRKSADPADIYILNAFVHLLLIWRLLEDRVDCDNPMLSFIFRARLNELNDLCAEDQEQLQNGIDYQEESVPLSSHKNMHNNTTFNKHTISKHPNDNSDQDVRNDQILLETENNSIEYIFPRGDNSGQDVRNDQILLETVENRIEFILPRTDNNYMANVSPRSGHRTFIHDDYFYVIGGFKRQYLEISQDHDRGVAVLHDIWRMNIKTKIWETCQITNSLPTLSILSLVRHTGYQMLLLGNTDEPCGVNDSINLYSLYMSEGKFNVFLEEVTGDKPPPTYSSSFISANDGSTYYLIDGDHYNIHIYRLKRKTNWHWDKITDDKTDMYSSSFKHEAFIKDDLIMIFGRGRTTKNTKFQTEALNEIPAYDIASKKFITLTTYADSSYGFPLSRKGFGAVQYDDHIYILGGCKHNNYGFAFNVLNDIWRLNLTTFKWTKFEKTLSIEVFFHSASITEDGTIYIFGRSCDSQAKPQTNMIQYFNIREMDHAQAGHKNTHSNVSSNEHIKFNDNDTQSINNPDEEDNKSNRFTNKPIIEFFRPTKIDLASKNFLPNILPRSGHRTFIQDDYFYVVGGYNNQIATVLDEIWRMKIKTNIWETCKITRSLPTTIASFSLVSHNEYQMLLLGGTGYPLGINMSFTNDLYSLHMSKGKFNVLLEKVTGENPHPCYGSPLVSANDGSTYYLIKGNDEVPNKDNTHIWRLKRETENWHWTKMTDDKTDMLPKGRFKHEAFIKDDLIMIFGGGGSTTNTKFQTEALNEIPAFDIASKKFIKIKTYADSSYGFPWSRKAFGAVQHDDHIFILGGCNYNHKNELNVLNDIWRLNLTTFKWTKFEKTLPEGVFFHSASITKDGTIYIFGGSCDTKTQTNIVQYFNIYETKK